MQGVVVLMISVRTADFCATRQTSDVRRTSVHGPGHGIGHGGKPCDGAGNGRFGGGHASFIILMGGASTSGSFFHGASPFA